MSDKHDGQRPLRSVEAALEADAALSRRPRGMPPLSAIQTELARMGYPASDAEDVYDGWLASGFRTKAGPILDWKASLRMRIRRGWLDSQRKAKAMVPNFIPPTEAEVLAWAKTKHPRWPTSYAKWCYQWFVGQDWRYFGKAIASTARWQALMETDLMDRAPK